MLTPKPMLAKEVKKFFRSKTNKLYLCTAKGKPRFCYHQNIINIKNIIR